jgi:protein-S-isoprenylcysteine O-methyltransferase Ste14
MRCIETDILIIKILLLIIIAFSLIGILIPMIYIKSKGIDPHGTHENSSVLTRFTSVSIILWVVYCLLFLVWDELMINTMGLNLFNIDLLIIIGMILVGIGFLIELLGIMNLGLNFRIELPKEETKLITTGIYRIIRNPIVLGLLLVIFGSVLIIPTFISILLFVFNVITFNAKIKDKEEF